MKNDVDNEIKSNLERQFGRLFEDQPAPEHLKKRLFSRVDGLRLLTDLVDLFTTKFWQTKSQFLQIFDEKDPEKPDDLPSDQQIGVDTSGS